MSATVPCGHTRITERQRQLLQMAAHGMPNHEIAESLGLAEKTVKNYFAILNQELGTTNRTQAVVLAWRSMAIW